MARITIEDCLDKIGNHFKLVMVASHRARQLQDGAPPKIEAANEKPNIIALREIAESKIGEDILEEPLAKDEAAEKELAELIAHGLMEQEVSAKLNAMAEEREESKEDDGALEEQDALETGIEDMEAAANLTLDHLKADDDSFGQTDKALISGLSKDELAIGEKLISQMQGEEQSKEQGDEGAEDRPASEEDKPA